MPRLETSSGWSRLTADIKAVFAPSTGSMGERGAILKTVLLRSVRITVSSSGQAPVLPLRIRPAFVVLNVLDLILLGILGFHPRGQTWIRLNDKLLHFVCFFLATAMFYMIWDVDEPARTSYLWRNASLILSAITCLLVGGIGSEIVQSLLPYKQFQIGDIVANLLGSSLGLWFSYHLEKRYRARRELERLYAPLDIEDYGDLLDDEDDGADLDPTPNPRSSLKTSSSTAGANKKTRFAADVWDDSLDIDNLPARGPARAAPEATPAVSGSTSRQDIFTIDDNEPPSPPAQPNVWTQAQ
ncbi:hypothetical protein PANT_5c00057 [Moesziomyces antarcticus T-34]|uniref:VanZ-like domain-containing protein n=1 Tax=Pseudozyma antarctica (strain T-34) TaxID=1151754 RepID=M9LXR9_PSEA3|nr:hypothetical protein PANT_5c00057 [Moesziomyces antarcticus T-34]